MKYWLLLCIWLGVTAVSAAEPTEDPYSPEALAMIGAKLTIAERNLQIWQKTPDSAALEELIAQSTQFEQTAQECIADGEKQKTQSQEGMKSLGVQQDSEDVALRQKRNELDHQTKNVERRLAQCRLVSLRSTTLQKTARALIQQDLKERMFAHDESLYKSIQALMLDPSLITKELQSISNALLNLELNWNNISLALLYGVIGAALGALLLHYRNKKSVLKQDTTIAPTFYAVWRSLKQLFPAILFSGFVYLYLKYYSSNSEIVDNLALYLFIAVLIYAILRAPLQEGVKIADFKELSPSERRTIRFHIQIFALAGTLFLLLSTDLFDALSSNLVNITRITLSIIMVLMLMRIIWKLSHHFLLIKRLRLQWITVIALSIAAGAEFLGYRNFAEFLFQGIFSTLFVIMVVWLLQRIPNEVCDGLDEGRAQWQKELRKRVGAKEGQYFPGLIWVRLIILLTLNLIGIVVLLRLWGMPEQNITLLLNKALNGVEIGNFKLEPLRIISGIVIMGLLISLSQIFKRYLAEHWLSRTSLSRGARDAVATISGYTGILFAILIGLSVAGLQFQNLAIIAGALSVGIGFGLQNIVNNFVSGLILLFERPIRRGDWIRVGTAEGYVKQISIRSTIIQDFDLADIIVPNSELISGRVTNLFLNNNNGRVIIPLKVAYGTDTEKLIKMLLDITKNFSDIIQNQPDLKPIALFRSYGESALNFDLRFYIWNIELKFNVTSDVLVAIDKMFRAQGIVVPYPQYMVHQNGDNDPIIQLPAPK